MIAATQTNSWSAALGGTMERAAKRRLVGLIEREHERGNGIADGSLVETVRHLLEVRDNTRH